MRLLLQLHDHGCVCVRGRSILHRRGLSRLPLRGLFSSRDVFFSHARRVRWLEVVIFCAFFILCTLPATTRQHNVQASAWRLVFGGSSAGILLRFASVTCGSGRRSDDMSSGVLAPRRHGDGERLCSAVWRACGAGRRGWCVPYLSRYPPPTLPLRSAYSLLPLSQRCHGGVTCRRTGGREQNNGL